MCSDNSHRGKNNKTVIFDDIYEYEVEATREGGMGRVLILNRKSNFHTEDSLLEAIMRQPNMTDEYGFVYRKKLAAKTFKDDDLVERNKDLFERELRIWLNIDSNNVAKLLKIVFVDHKLFALMPYYNSNLREIIMTRKGCVGRKLGTATY